MLGALLASNLFFQSYSQSDPFGRLIFLLIYLLSILSWTQLIYKIKLIKRAKYYCKKHTGAVVVVVVVVVDEVELEVVNTGVG